MRSPPSPLNASGSPTRSQPRGGCRDPKRFIFLIKLTQGSPEGIATYLAFLFCLWQTQDGLCMGQAGSEGWINYLQRVHDLSRFHSSIRREQLHLSAQAGFLGGSASAVGDGPLPYTAAASGHGSFRSMSRSGPCCPLCLLPFSPPLSRKRAERAETAPPACPTDYRQK